MTERTKVYTKILTTLKRLMPTTSQSHVVTIAMMMTGLVLGRRGQLSAMSQEVATKAQDASVEKRFSRFVKDERVEYQLMMLPFARELVEALATQTIYLVIDSSTIGRGCRVSMVCMLYGKRALPIGWVVYKGQKGHAMVANHLKVLQAIAPVLVNHPNVIFLGDAEFDTVDLLFWIQEATGWELAVRTSPTALLTMPCGQIKMGELIERQGQFEAIYHVAFTEREFPNVLAIARWNPTAERPLYLISTLHENPCQVCDHYAHRFQIETFFSDQKSRGFHLDKSHISDPRRLERLLLPACLAYIWLVFLGADVSANEQKRRLVDRSHRTDKSLFRLGIDWLKNALKRRLSFQVFFSPLDFGQFAQPLVR